MTDRAACFRRFSRSTRTYLRAYVHLRWKDGIDTCIQNGVHLGVPAGLRDVTGPHVAVLRIGRTFDSRFVVVVTSASFSAVPCTPCLLTLPACSMTSQVVFYNCPPCPGGSWHVEVLRISFVQGDQPEKTKRVITKCAWRRTAVAPVFNSWEPSVAACERGKVAIDRPGTGRIF